ncbi:MAG: isochorismatase family protein [Casimicrobiaceae bacterium]
MTPSLRLQRERSVLVVVDVQERLAPHVADHETLIARIGVLLAVAEDFAIPRRLTEHCAERIGPVLPQLRTHFDEADIFAKTRFGAADDPAFVQMLRATGRDQLVVAGMEGHVCVMQTVLGLIQHGFATFPVVDAIGSRPVRSTDRTLALERMRAAGATLVATEMVLFEWTYDGHDPAFRSVLGHVKALS